MSEAIIERLSNVKLGSLSNRTGELKHDPGT